ncbi:MAG: phosphofructokinase, partial [Deltaproteobacteria bacterium]|nr:phosphofructokinase [Deltaproteobacteria bacterium]
YDRTKHRSNYSVLLVSEGATLQGNDMSFVSDETDQYGHRKLGGIGDVISAMLKEMSPKMNDGRRINVVNQRLSYLVRCGAPDAMDSIVPMAFGNMALNLIDQNRFGRLINVRNGIYDHVPVDVVTGRKKVVDVDRYYSRDRLRPLYKSFERQPTFIMTSDV